MAQFASTLYPQTNPTNPVLLAFRSDPGREKHTVWASAFGPLTPENSDAEESIREAIQNLDYWGQRAVLDHSERVLTRLASLSG